METLRALTPADVSACVALAADRDWPPEPAKWWFLLTAGTGFGVFDGVDLVGTAVVTRFGDVHAALSMVLVARGHGGRGLGRRVVEHALAFADIPLVSLYATAFGKPLYEKLGFRSVGRTAGHFGTLTAPPSGVSRPAGRADRARVVAEDAAVFGADRSAMWARLFDFAHEVRVADGGFAASWRNTDRLMVGPVVADSVGTAKALIADLAGDGPARVDVADPELAAWLSANGMPARFEVDQMVRGDLTGDRGRLYAPVMQALG
ncbi:GNAT superfamily N-acetyltransferase [Saccharothrix tamanrassetensis]|uniref:GNAT superfamily N-acetyltransferase n=1 Tax=Saccharothrix tamanrassetensis TaxID=1051531 RepID=A0A841CNZ8_9PSEU|nr:GNAT family N-acetyltransferase [Saccharothrix tamanrassetensis]MBB5957797.1 GNAT superfamily N-acetyltransferase [Saccharothrix tamanrassetensis]